MHKLGLIGGTGPESTVIYYKELVAGVQDVAGEHSLPPLVIESLSVFRVLEYCADQDYEGLTRYLLNAVEDLAAAGCEVASLSALTPHIVFDSLREKSPLPLISAVDATRDAIIAQGINRVALLGTEPTMTNDFFVEPLRAAGIAVSIPNENEISYIQTKIATELEYGIVAEDTLKGFIKILDRMKDDDGAQAVILGCTELPLLLNDENSPLPCIDPIASHTKELIAAITADWKRYL